MLGAVAPQTKLKTENPSPPLATLRSKPGNPTHIVNAGFLAGLSPFSMLSSSNYSYSGASGAGLEDLRVKGFRGFGSSVLV